jgi:branched-chain amino acid transport system ATP-binding protein
MLSVKNIESWYDLIRALHGISFEVNEGDIVTLLGSNGAGKTTTLKTIMRLLGDDQPEKGVVEFMGSRIDRKDTEEIVRLGISYVPEGREVFPELTVMENILMGAYTRKDKGGIKADIDKIFMHFPILEKRRKQQAGYMSGGEQQMLAIGRALMSAPKVLLLDEPSLGLAPILVKQIFDIIAEINAQGTTILLVEQNAHKALTIASRGYVLENGRIAAAGLSHDLKSDPKIREAYLGGSAFKKKQGQ